MGCCWRKRARALDLVYWRVGDSTTGQRVRVLGLGTRAALVSIVDFPSSNNNHNNEEWLSVLVVSIGEECHGGLNSSPTATRFLRVSSFGRVVGRGADLLFACCCSGGQWPNVIKSGRLVACSVTCVWLLLSRWLRETTRLECTYSIGARSGLYPSSVRLVECPQLYGVLLQYA